MCSERISVRRRPPCFDREQSVLCVSEWRMAVCCRQRSEPESVAGANRPQTSTARGRRSAQRISDGLARRALRRRIASHRRGACPRAVPLISMHRRPPVPAPAPHSLRSTTTTTIAVCRRSAWPRNKRRARAEQINSACGPQAYRSLLVLPFSERSLQRPCRPAEP